jgi:hypothetical protein
MSTIVPGSQQWLPNERCRIAASDHSLFHSIFILPLRTTALHAAISACINEVSSAGEPGIPT